MDRKLKKLKLRIIQADAKELFYHYDNRIPFVVKNKKNEFHPLYKDILPPNLDTYFLQENGKLNTGEVVTRSSIDKPLVEYYTDDFVNVSFEYSMYIDEEGNLLDKKPDTTSKIKYKTTEPSTLRKELYTNGFDINNKHYVRYKRSAGAAKSGSCLFINEKLSKLMDRWTNMGLDKNGKCFDQLTSFEAYKSLSLSSLDKVFELNPDNILFVKDVDVLLKNQEVIKVSLPEGEDILKAEESCCDIKNSIFDGEGLLDISVFEKIGKQNKGMALLRNRYFKCCAFNTNLQKWFEDNNITDISQLNGITFAADIKDIVLVASESCLKYLKLSEEVKTKTKIKKWCSEVKKDSPMFGIVKYDKPTRFFDGRMVETTYQLLNTINLRKQEYRYLLSDYVDYISKIKDIKKTPECIRYYLEGEYDDSKQNDDYEDDSEDTTIDEIANDVLSYSSDTFKNKICLELVRIDAKIKETDIFKQRVYRSITESFVVKLYNGRILVDGTYATLFGNPYEYLLHIINKFDVENPESLLGEGEICTSFFSDGETVLGSRAPHTTMANILISKNKRLKEIDQYFNLTDQIVVVDAINNNIQHRLSGCDYDSDSVLITNNKVMVDCASEFYNYFKVPYAAYNPKKESPINKKDGILKNLIKIDNKIASNNVGRIVNLSQRLNSHFWDEYNRSTLPNRGIYKNAALLSVLSGAEIDSAKRDFPFTISDQIDEIDKYRKEYFEDMKPLFWRILEKPRGHRPDYKFLTKKQDEKKEKAFETSMDVLWSLVKENRLGEIKKVNTVKFYQCIEKFDSKGAQEDKYIQVEKAYNTLKKYEGIINEYKFQKNNNDYEISKSDFYHRIDEAFNDIRININTINKARMLIRDIENKDNGYSKLFILLFVIDCYHKKLGYGLKDLFRKGVKPLPTLTEVKDNNIKTDHTFFKKFNYKICNF